MSPVLWVVGRMVTESRKVSRRGFKMIIKAIPIQPTERLGRICPRCLKRYVPTGKYQKICNRCFNKSQKERTYTVFCKCCGARCNNQYKIELRKGIYYPFCKICFDSFYNKSNKEINKIIKSKHLNSIWY